MAKEIVKDPDIGDKVVRGRDWDWEGQDSGSVYGVVTDIKRDGWCRVEWRNEKGYKIQSNSYRIGNLDKYDLYYYNDGKSTEKRKFSVGDLVTGTPSASRMYATTIKGWVGKVVSVFEDGNGIEVECIHTGSRYCVDDEYFEKKNTGGPPRPKFSVGDMVKISDEGEGDEAYKFRDGDDESTVYYEELADIQGWEGEVRKVEYDAEKQVYYYNLFATETNSRAVPYLMSGYVAEYALRSMRSVGIEVRGPVVLTGTPKESRSPSVIKGRNKRSIFVLGKRRE